MEEEVYINLEDQCIASSYFYDAIMDLNFEELEKILWLLFDELKTNTPEGIEPFDKHEEGIKQLRELVVERLRLMGGLE